MRIAFDVKGTIEGPSKTLVLSLLKGLKARGHEIVVWSNAFQFAQDAVDDNQLTGCSPISKRASHDLGFDESQYLDLAIEDDSSQTWLASKRFIWVHNLPKTDEGIAKLVESITAGNWDDTKCQLPRRPSRSM
jgi:hypothetical protein